jgi:uncharacterized protein with ParB-like and HNH nuclease domain
MINILNRSSIKLTVSDFYENYKNNKYRFVGNKYKWSSEVWSTERGSLFIDSILKNFPTQMIFMRPTIDNETDRLVYDIIDGRQRLRSVINFIEN